MGRRRRVIDAATRWRILRLGGERRPVREIGRLCGVNRSTVRLILDEAGLGPPPAGDDSLAWDVAAGRRAEKMARAALAGRRRPGEPPPREEFRLDAATGTLRIVPRPAADPAEDPVGCKARPGTKKRIETYARRVAAGISCFSSADAFWDATLGRWVTSAQLAAVLKRHGPGPNEKSA
jgi:hypothetical protein